MRPRIINDIDKRAHILEKIQSQGLTEINNMGLESLLDHTCLKPIATEKDMIQLCEEAHELNTATVCLPVRYVPLAVEIQQRLKSSWRVCTVCGFPLGSELVHIKTQEALYALDKGALEIDFVQNLHLVKEQKFHDLERETRDLINHIKSAQPKAVVKVILETCFLTDDEIIACTKAHLEGGTDYIKTSTGFGTGGAELRHLTLIKDSIKGYICGIKASGGIKTRAQALEMIKFGATRIGTSSAKEILAKDTSKPEKRNDHDNSTARY